MCPQSVPRRNDATLNVRSRLRVFRRVRGNHNSATNRRGDARETGKKGFCGCHCRHRVDPKLLAESPNRRDGPIFVVLGTSVGATASRVAHVPGPADATPVDVQFHSGLLPAHERCGQCIALTPVGGLRETVGTPMFPQAGCAVRVPQAASPSPSEHCFDAAHPHSGGCVGRGGRESPGWPRRPDAP